MSQPKKTTDEPSISELLAQLDELMAWFNQDDVDIELALAKFEEATKLSDIIQKRLGKVENDITVLKKRFDIETT